MLALSAAERTDANPALVPSMEPARNRQPKGLPVGGQFAAGHRQESTQTLTLPHDLRIGSTHPTKRFVGRCEHCVRPVVAESDSAVASATCPECGRKVHVERIVGFVTSMECSAACESAVGPRCECACGGENHSGRFQGQGEAPESAVEAYRATQRKRQAAAQAKRERAAAAKDAAVQRWKDQHPVQAAWLSERAADPEHPRGHIARDMLDYLGRKKGLTDNQLAFIDRLKAEDDERELKDREKAPPKAAPSGTTEVVGKILAIRFEESHFSRYGGQLKMLVESDGGWRSWGTMPSSLAERSLYKEPAKVGDRVRFTAELEPSQDDAAFAFCKRPRKAEVLQDAPVANTADA